MVINLRRIAAAAGVVLLLALVYLVGVTCLQAGEGKKESKTGVEAEQPLVEKKQPKVKYTQGFFAEYRMERERVRGEQVELLREMLNNPNVDEKSRAAAAAHLVEISEALEQEIKTEALIKARGFQDCVVIIQAQCTVVVVPVRTSSLPLDQEEELKKAVSRMAGCPPENVSVIVYRG